MPGNDERKNVGGSKKLRHQHPDAQKPFKRSSRKIGRSVILGRSDGLSGLTMVTDDYRTGDPFLEDMSDRSFARAASVDWRTPLGELLDRYDEVRQETPGGGVTYDAPEWSVPYSDDWFATKAACDEDHLWSLRERVLKAAADEQDASGEREVLDLLIDALIDTAAATGALAVEYNWSKHAPDVFARIKQKCNLRDDSEGSRRTSNAKRHQEAGELREEIRRIAATAPLPGFAREKHVQQEFERNNRKSPSGRTIRRAL